MTATKETPARGLHIKLAEVMAEAERIPKNGEYKGQGQFKYVLVGDAADAIRKALGERKVSMLPSAVEVISESEHETRSGGTMTTLTIRTTWTLVDGETGETAVIQSIGTGADSGDKASPKAQTNAMKYALLMGFLLSTGDDPEQADSSDRQAPAKADQETVELLGNIQKTGTLKKGTAPQYKGDWTQDPNGHSIGLRLVLDGEDRDIPQVRICGVIGEALYLAHPGQEGPTPSSVCDRPVRPTLRSLVAWTTRHEVTELRSTVDPVRRYPPGGTGQGHPAPIAALLGKGPGQLLTNPLMGRTVSPR